MSTDSRMAQASARLSSLSARREGWHMVRFDWVKTGRTLKALRDDLNAYGLMTDETDKQIAAVEALARDGRAEAWTNIQRLDNEITTLTGQVNNGVYDEIR